MDIEVFGLCITLLFLYDKSFTRQQMQKPIYGIYKNIELIKIAVKPIYDPLFPSNPKVFAYYYSPKKWSPII